MYAGRPGGSQSIPSVGTKPTAADKQPFLHYWKFDGYRPLDRLHKIQFTL